MADLRPNCLSDNLSEILLPTHRAKNWVNKWIKNTPNLNKEVHQIFIDRVDVLVQRFNIKAESPAFLSVALNGIIQRYNGLIYEENGIIMEIDLFSDVNTDDDNVDRYFFGLGNTPIFNKYLYDNYPEVLI